MTWEFSDPYSVMPFLVLPEWAQLLHCPWPCYSFVWQRLVADANDLAIVESDSLLRYCLDGTIWTPPLVILVICCGSVLVFMTIIFLFVYCETRRATGKVTRSARCTPTKKTVIMRRVHAAAVQLLRDSTSVLWQPSWCS